MRTSLQPAVAMQSQTQTVRLKSDRVRTSTGAAPQTTPHELFGHNVREQDAVRAAATLLESRATRLSERLDAASVALQQSSSAPATVQRARANRHAVQTQLDQISAQLHNKQLQLQKLVAESNQLLPSLPAYARIPMEIYSVIVETAYAEFVADADFLSASRFPWLLCGVCSWWRSMTPTLPRLWATVHFPIRASFRHDQDLDLLIGRQLSFASPHPCTLTLRLSIQQGAHVCKQRPQADKYRACLQRVLDRTDTIIIADRRPPEFSCNDCLRLFVTESAGLGMVHLLLGSAVFVGEPNSKHTPIPTWQYLSPAACAQLRKIFFRNLFPKVDPNDLFPLVEELEIDIPLAECDFFFVQGIFDACPSLHTLHLNCGQLLSFRSWGMSTFSSTLKYLTLKINNLDESIMENYPIRLDALRKLTLVFPDMAFSPITLADCDIEYTRTSLVGTILQHTPRLSSLSVTGIPMAAVVRVLPNTISPVRLKTFSLGGTYVKTGAAEELAKTSKAPLCVTFFGCVAIERGDLWNECLISLGDGTGEGLEELAGTALLRFISPVDMQLDRMHDQICTIHSH